MENIYEESGTVTPQQLKQLKTKKKTRRVPILKGRPRSNWLKRLFNSK